MGIFSRKSHDKDFNKQDNELESLAREAVNMEPAIRDRAKGFLEKYTLEKERQVDGFLFECKRFGDFLSVFITRKGNPTVNGKHGRGTEYASSINLRQVKLIILETGRDVDSSGFVGVFMREHGGKMTIREQTITVPKSRPFLVDGEKSAHNKHMYAGRVLYALHSVDNFPRPSEDDKIVFHGADITLTAPFGLGQSVHDAIMAECDAYFRNE